MQLGHGLGSCCTMSLGSGLAAGLLTRLVAVVAFTGYGSANSQFGAVTACSWLPCEGGQQASEWTCGRPPGLWLFGAGPLAWVGVAWLFWTVLVLLLVADSIDCSVVAACWLLNRIALGIYALSFWYWGCGLNAALLGDDVL